MRESAPPVGPRRLFAIATVLLSTCVASAVGVGGYRLVERSSYRLLGTFRQLDLMRAYLRDARIRRFARALHDTDPRTALFSTQWDTNWGVLLSRHMYQTVTMDGVQKYAYRPNLKKLSFWAGASFQFWKMETEDTPVMRAAIADLDTQLLVTASYDEFGFRRTDPDLARDCQSRALFLGDSFTDGVWVGDGDTFANKYARLARERSSFTLCPVNAGVNGYGSLEERYTLEHQFEHAGRPSIVFVMYFANDVDQDHDAVITGQLRDAARLWQESLAQLDKMKRFADEHQVRLVLAAIPPREQILDKVPQTYYQDILRDFCERDGITFVNLFEGLVSHGLQGLYLDGDPHFTPLGHQVVAELLYDATKGLLK